MHEAVPMKVCLLTPICYVSLQHQGPHPYFSNNPKNGSWNRQGAENAKVNAKKKTDSTQKVNRVSAFCH
jgi:hypothetical protein